MTTPLMQGAYYDRNGAARDVLRVGKLQRPEPAAGEVLVRVHSSGGNPSDVKSRRGSRGMPFERMTPQSDGAGVIAGVGEGVEQTRLG